MLTDNPADVSHLKKKIIKNQFELNSENADVSHQKKIIKNQFELNSEKCIEMRMSGAENSYCVISTC